MRIWIRTHEGVMLAILISLMVAAFIWSGPLLSRFDKPDYAANDPSLSAPSPSSPTTTIVARLKDVDKEHVTMQCDGFGHRVYTLTNDHDNAGGIAVIADPLYCPRP